MGTSSSTTLNRPAHAGNPPWAWRYNPAAIALHWTLALLIAATTALGWTMMAFEDQPGSASYFNLHKSVGLLIALLVVCRIAWRLAHPPQRLPPHLPQWQVNLAAGTQLMLYVLMVLMPVTGYLGASFSKAGIRFFGLPLPPWAIPDHDRAEQFFDIHSLMIWVLVGLVFMHALGALKHLLRDKDGVFQRMWFGGNQTPG